MEGRDEHVLLLHDVNIADFAASAPWTGIKGKPLLFPPEPHRTNVSDLERSGALNNQTLRWDGATYQFITYNQLPGPIGPAGPSGPQGAQGSQGSQGAQGSQGGQGSTGAQGAQGNQGNQGNQGAQGATGNAGTQGNPGAQGGQGNTGATGPNGNKGDQGFQGAKGDPGSQGPQGFQGPPGDKTPYCNGYADGHAQAFIDGTCYDDGFNNGFDECMFTGCTPCDATPCDHPDPGC